MQSPAMTRIPKPGSPVKIHPGVSGGFAVQHHTGDMHVFDSVEGMADHLESHFSEAPEKTPGDSGQSPAKMLGIDRVQPMSAL